VDALADPPAHRVADDGTPEAPSRRDPDAVVIAAIRHEADGHQSTRTGAAQGLDAVEVATRAERWHGTLMGGPAVRR
jgi:hypothetical protein